MTELDKMVAGNLEFAEGHEARELPGRPARSLAILTCMDARLDPQQAFGLGIGDAHVLRNAGGLPTDDALRSLAISQRALGTTAIALVHHTRCGMLGFDDDAFRAELSEQTGDTPSWRVPGFDDVSADVARSVQTVRTCAWLPHRDEVRGFVYDVDTHALREVKVREFGDTEPAAEIDPPNEPGEELV